MSSAATALSNAPGEPFFRAVYARLLCSELGARGIDVAPLLADAGLTAEALGGSASWLSVPQFLHLCARARAACPDPLLALHWGRRITDNSHGLVGTAVLSAPDLRQALRALHLASVLRSTTIRTTYAENESEACLCYTMLQPLGELNDFIHAPLALMIVQTLASFGAGVLAQLRVELPFARPIWAAEAASFYPGPVRFGAERLTFCLPAAQLPVANPLADPVAHAAALRQCELDRLGLEQNLLARVVGYLAAHAERAPSAEEVAGVLCLSSRSLRRALAESGTGFRALLNDARMGAARRYLDATPLSIEQLAWRLNYADTGNFIRAFRQAHGVTPAQYRQRQR